MSNPSLLALSISAIAVGIRFRKDYGDLTGLKESLRTIGIIHPIVLAKRNVLTDDGYSHDLIAGGRRLAATQALGYTDLFHGAILEPGRVGFLFRDEVDESLLREVELHENLHRLQQPWHEQVLQIYEIHKLKRKLHGISNWGIRETAAFLGPGYGNSKDSVSQFIRIAKEILAGNEEVQNASNVTKAFGVICKQEEVRGLREINRRRSEALSSSKGDNTKGGDTVCTTRNSDNETEQSATPAVSIPLSSLFRHGDWRDLSFPLYDHIVCDPPFGLDEELLSAGLTGRGELVDSSAVGHEIEDNLLMLRTFLSWAFLHVRPGGFCCFFYDLDHHEKLQAWATDADWKVQRWPYIFTKPYPCKNGAPAYNTNKNYECLMILRRDSSAVLRAPMMTSHKSFNFKEGMQSFQNAFAKPRSVWTEIFSMIAIPGQSVLDPFAGECSSLLAALDFGLLPAGCEIAEPHFLRGTERLREAYTKLHGNVLFT